MHRVTLSALPDGLADSDFRPALCTLHARAPKGPFHQRANHERCQRALVGLFGPFCAAIRRGGCPRRRLALLRHLSRCRPLRAVL
eukprot:1378466-Lingulodinium_polyedra.AAC.1